jgi:hypothetical protein
MAGVRSTVNARYLGCYTCTWLVGLGKAAALESVYVQATTAAGSSSALFVVTKILNCIFA